MSIPGPDDIVRLELPNGVVVLVRENHASPSVIVSGYLRVGAYDERREQAGLSAFTSAVLMRGTVSRTFEQIYEELESVGASVGVSGATHTTTFGIKSLVEDLPLALDILADVLRNPTFPVEEIEKVRGEILTDLEERAHDTRRMASLVFHELAYPPEHPYSCPTTGYMETISELKSDDLVEFYSGGYGPQGMVIAVVGAVDADEALAQVEAAFADWAGAAYEREPLPEAPRIAEIRERALSIPGKTQMSVELGYPGPSRAEPDFLDAVLCNSVLGIFGLMGRLGENVRDRQGLAYYSYSRMGGGLGQGPWRVIAGVNPAQVEQAVASICAEIRRICEEPVSEEELADNRAFITGSLPLRLETNQGMAQAILDLERYGLGLDYLRRYSGLIEEITAARVQAAARRWLDPEAYALAMAGPP